MSNPFFSVVIPAHNAEHRISTLLNSIKSQSFHDYEIIVVCDSCDDNTENVAREYGAITDTVSFGLDGLTRDHALTLASGDWILFADDDDWFLDDSCFQKLADFIRTRDDTIDVVAFAYHCRNRGIIHPSANTIFVPRIDHVWSSCWRRSSIGDARFGNAVFSSDTYFLKAMRQRVRNYSLFDVPLYYYNFLRAGSQTDLFCRGIIHQSPVAE